MSNLPPNNILVLYICFSVKTAICRSVFNLVPLIDELLQVMSFFATAEHEKERLQYFASPEGRDDLYQYNQKERRTVLEVMIWLFFFMTDMHTAV